MFCKRLSAYSCNLGVRVLRMAPLVLWISWNTLLNCTVSCYRLVHVLWTVGMGPWIFWLGYVTPGIRICNDWQHASIGRGNGMGKKLKIQKLPKNTQYIACPRWWRVISIFTLVDVVVHSTQCRGQDELMECVVVYSRLATLPLLKSWYVLIKYTLEIISTNSSSPPPSPGNPTGVAGTCVAFFFMAIVMYIYCCLSKSKQHCVPPQISICSCSCRGRNLKSGLPCFGITSGLCMDGG